MRVGIWMGAAAGVIATFTALSQVAEAAPGAVKILHAFLGGTDGAVPEGPLLNVGGTLYGTTTEGGGTGCGGAGCGTVFAIGPNGGERVIHAFAGSPSDGATPLGGLVNVGGTLYGTTNDGGANTCGSVHCGTVFSIGVNGGENVIYNFKGGSDGELPEGDMVKVGALLYGTTLEGGGHTGCDTGLTCGTVFSISTGGGEQVIHAFAGVGSDGGNPSGALIQISGTLYGTTEFGGLSKCTDVNNKPVGCGVVYSMSTGGGDTILHAFKGLSDGKTPSEGVIDVGGQLFGTTVVGGAGSICQGGCGVMYSMSTGGVETVLHTFAQDAADGLLPAGLVLFGNNLYGVTYGGGSQGCANTEGCGIAYSASTGGVVTVLHNFGSSAKDAELPDSRLVVLGNKLYGVSTHGGTGSCTGPNGSTGCGTVFKLTP
jgi:uncharacterized repeat protein (TIGR03803 family)